MALTAVYNVLLNILLSIVGKLALYHIYNFSLSTCLIQCGTCPFFVIIWNLLAISKWKGFVQAKTKCNHLVLWLLFLFITLQKNLLCMSEKNSQILLRNSFILPGLHFIRYMFFFFESILICLLRNGRWYLDIIKSLCPSEVLDSLLEDTNCSMLCAFIFRIRHCPEKKKKKNYLQLFESDSVLIEEAIIYCNS